MNSLTLVPQPIAPLEPPAHTPGEALHLSLHLTHLALVPQLPEVHAVPRLTGTGSLSHAIAGSIAVVRILASIRTGFRLTAGKPRNKEPSVETPTVTRLDGGTPIGRHPVSVEQLVESLPILMVGTHQAAQAPAHALSVGDANALGYLQRLGDLAYAEPKSIAPGLADKIGYKVSRKSTPTL